MNLARKVTAAGMLAAVTLALLPVAPAVARPVDPDGCHAASRGRLLRTIALDHSERADVAAELRAYGLAESASHGVARYRLVYCTISPSGRGTAASGLFVLPDHASGRLPTVVYAHGTVSARTDAPSLRGVGAGEGWLVPMVFAAEGMAVAAPDYLGLGVSSLGHPYLHAATEASAAVDLLAAAAVAGARLNAPLSREVFVTGHSQGGHAAMAIGQRAATLGDHWRLRALAPMAGPYDLSGIALPAALDPARTEPASAAAYLAYLLVSWKARYGLYSDPREVFAEPYAATVEEFFDGEHGFDEIAAALPPAPLLLRPETLALLAHPTGRLAAALRDNDVCRWAPTVPVRLYVGQRDRDVVPEHAQRCREQVAARGGTVDVVDLGEVDHVGTAIAALPTIRTWFLQLRSDREIPGNLSPTT